MSQQGTGRPDGNFARRALGRAVNAVLDYFQHDEEYVGVADTNNATIHGGAEVLSLVLVIDKTNDTLALYEVQGATGGTSLLVSGAGSYGTTQGTDAQTNLYYDTDHYELENQTGGEVDYEVFSIRVP